MANTDDDAKEPEGALGGEETEDGDGAGKTPGKKLVLFILAPILLLLIGGGAYFFLAGDEEEHVETPEELMEDGPPAVAVFFNMEEMLVNLSSTGPGQPYLKLSVALELTNTEDLAAIEPLMPRVVNSFQVYLRELRLEDLSGSAGMYRLKEELMRRVNKSVQPIKVTDILFREMLIQ